MLSLGLGLRTPGERAAAVALEIGLVLFGTAAAILGVLSGIDATLGADPSAIVTALTSVT